MMRRRIAFVIILRTQPDRFLHMSRCGCLHVWPWRMRDTLRMLNGSMVGVYIEIWSGYVHWQGRGRFWDTRDDHCMQYHRKRWAISITQYFRLLLSEVSGRWPFGILSFGGMQFGYPFDRIYNHVAPPVRVWAKIFSSSHRVGLRRGFRCRGLNGSTERLVL